MSPPALPLRPDRQAYLLLVLANLFWGGNFVVARAMHEAIPPLQLAFWRWALALVLLLPWALADWRRDSTALRRQGGLVAVLGLVGVAGFNSLVYLALQRTSAVSAVLMISSCPVLIAALAWMLFREPLGWRAGLGVALSLGGVALLLAQGEPDRLLAPGAGAGDWWALAAAAVWAVYTVLLRLRPAGIGAAGFLAAMVAVGTAALAPLALTEAWLVRPMPASPQALAAVGYVALFASVASWLCWNRGVELIGGVRAGAFVHLTPAFGTLFAILLLGETLQPFHLTAAAAIAAGIALAARRPQITDSIRATRG